MKITSAELRKEFAKVWPDLEYIWLWDTEFLTGTKAQVDRLMEKSRVKDMEFIPSFNDCDDFALQFLAEVRRVRYFSWKEGSLEPENRVPFAIFFAQGTQFRGISKVHAANIVLLDDGFYLIDMTPGEQRMWKADKDQDTIIFVHS